MCTYMCVCLFLIFNMIAEHRWKPKYLDNKCNIYIYIFNQLNSSEVIVVTLIIGGVGNHGESMLTNNKSGM